MTLPATFSVGDIATQNLFQPPFISSGGDIFAVLTDGFLLRLQFTEDPTTTNFIQADSEIMGAGANIQSQWVYQRGGEGNNTLDVVVQKASTGSSETFRVLHSEITLDPTTPADSTAAAETIVDTAPHGDDGPDAVGCSVSREETGTDIVVAYQGEEDMDMGSEFARIDVKRWTGSSWGSIIAIDNGGGEHWTAPVIVQGSSDRMHIFFKELNADDGFQRTLRSDDSLQTFPSSYATTFPLATYPYCNGIAFASGGDEKIRITFNTNDLDIWGFNSADSPTPTELATAINTATTFSPSITSGRTITLAVDGDTQHIFWSGGGGSGLDKDLYTKSTGSDNDTWADEDETLPNVDVNSVFSNVYNRSGIKLAYIYDDGGTVKYNEIILGGTPVSDILDLRWDLSGVISDTLDLRWNIKENIQDILDLRWNILVNVQDVLDLRWNILQNAEDILDLRWDMNGSVQDILDLRWNIKQNVQDTLDLRWNIFQRKSKTSCIFCLISHRKSRVSSTSVTPASISQRNVR